MSEDTPTQDNYTVEREDGPQAGRWVVHLAPGEEGEMTYRRVAPGVLAVDHTGVPRAYRGSGIALKLMNAAIAAARAENFKIIPYCSYVATQFERHPEWADLRTGG